MTRYYAAQDVQTGELLPGLPSLRLISNGGGDAYVSEDMGIVYLKDKGYESPDGTYRRVRIVRDPESLEEERRWQGLFDG